MKKLLLLFGCICTTMFAFVQNRQVSGTVTDDEFTPLRGVHVMVCETGYFANIWKITTGSNR